MGNNKKNNKGADVSVFKPLAPLLIAALAAILVAGGATWFYQTRVADAAQQQQAATQLAQSIANLAQSHIKAHQQQLALLATRNDIDQALSTDTVANFNAHHHQWLPDASLRLVPRRGANTDDFSYTAQQLLKEVRLGQSPGPAIIAGQPPTLILVKATRTQSGALLLQVPLSVLAKSLQDLAPAGSQLQVTFAGSNLFSQPDNNNGTRVDATSGQVLVQLTLPPTDSNLLMISTIVVALGIVLLLLGTLLVNRLLARFLKQDCAELIRYCDELARQPGVSARNHFHFPLFSTVNDAQARMATKLRERGGPHRSAVKKQSEDLVVVEENDDSILLMDEKQGETLPDSIFRAYDIRGVAGDTLTAQGVYLLGRAIGTEAGDAGQQSVLVARDGRLSSPELSRSLIKGLLESGRDVINLGLVPTPVLYYATEVLETRSGVMLTGSHNPTSHNGLKIVINGDTLYGERITALQERIRNKAFSEGKGREEERDIADRYLDDILSDIVLARSLRVAIDCGNGAGGELAPRLFQQLGCEVTSLYTDIDGNFPNHAPDPGNPDNLADLIRIVQEENLDLGLAFDGDADRVAVVTNSGEIIWPDRLLMLFAKDLLGRSPGADILFDVKCSRALPAIIRKNGGRPMMYKTGHSLIKAKMKECGAPLAGEISGHIFFADRWFGCDDGLYAGARLLEILSLQDDSAGQVFDGLKTGLTTPALYIDVSEENKFALVDALAARAEQFAGGRPTTIDGLRVDFPDGWGLVRASNTTPSLVARFEGRDEEALERVKEQFRKHLQAVDDSLELPF
ncbi:phosphomannomutase/phosphoglucomutase [Alcanivorax jadensis]|jgi:phosphomannomutase/phosphoglucomutase|uniref:phosphomannomutase/phosphoglucomutase n=1 Tax=Alcanivorax jadensis TaxID=64988 RepID=UPI0023565C8B|nr:phosphomannomutase/phosphoglucomutase [Alcanivorax jadensis]MDF1636020.1 phosphomannomutase/phosphoglucomutase [Alcanivorax jadensis]|tara:strand:+ start:609 stop:3005 length:2397 start_codon:yes stop_codon:yes gene_type:complete